MRHELFVELRRTGSRKIRDRLVQEHMALAYREARRYLRPSASLDDLRQVALIGLLKAVQRYDPWRGTTFTTFAVPTIAGELRRYYRDRTWTVRPPRRVLDDVVALRTLVEQLTHERGRSPSASEIASRSGLAVDRVVQATVAGDGYAPTALPDEIENGLAYCDGELERIEQRATLTALLERLPTRKRAVVTMRFFDGMTQSEIGARLGISQMQVSRDLRKSLSILRACANVRTEPKGAAP